MTKASDNEAFIRDVVQPHLGLTADGWAGGETRDAWRAKFGGPARPEGMPRDGDTLVKCITNTRAPALTDDDFKRVAAELNVTVGIIRAVRRVEAPRGAFDDQGRVTILYERHVFARNTQPKGKFNGAAPDLSGSSGYGAGGYGSFPSQYDRLRRAYGLDPVAALKGCSWGAFQVLGENAESMGYASVWDMVKALAVSEAAHLDSFARFVRVNGLGEELRACRPGDAESCIPFVRAYNGPGFRAFKYHEKLAQAAL